MRNDSFFSNSPLGASDIPINGELDAILPYSASLPPQILHEPFSLTSTLGDGNNHAALVRANQILMLLGIHM